MIGPMDPEAREEAWPPVLDAIAAAMDVPGLAPEDRGALAKLHDKASWWAGHKRLDPPEPQAVEIAQAVRTKSAWARADTDAGLWVLVGGRGNGCGEDRFILWRLMAHGIGTIDELRAFAADPSRLRGVPQLGPKRSARVLELLEAHASDRLRA